MPTVLAPWGLFARHAGRPDAYFLDRAGTDVWSFAGSCASAQLLVRDDGRVLHGERGAWRDVGGDPIEAIAAFVHDGEADVRAEPFSRDVALPRTVGFLAYELGRYAQPVALRRSDPLGLPVALLSRYDEFDAWHPRYGAREAVRFRAAPLTTTALPPLPLTRSVGAGAPPLYSPHVDVAAELAYRRGFARIKEAIRAGDIYQANLSRRITMALSVPPAIAYRRLRAAQPVPNGAFLDLGRRQILSNSPECFLHVAGNTVSTWPIKGTRARATDRRDPEADRRVRAELLADPKEMAEHIMIVDLERSDLGRVCEIGSITVPRRAFVQSFRTLHHLVSEVRGHLREDCGLADVLRATFPGGSITGAPKIRAMQIIDEVEPSARGVYTGAIGTFNGSRSVDLNIAIRTAITGDGRADYHTGGGIVADSRLQCEHEETVTKARAFLDTVAAPHNARGARP